ncbi:hypothetical protein HOI26_00645 [Candidatus Woesearchaeota archaeon]|nr:hypothetical protein [Candidatus Woesearchaeota archaeon]
MQKKMMLVGFVLIAILFVAGCSSAPGDSVQSTEAALEQARTGTEGVKTSFLNNFPPPLIYDENELVTLLEIENKGGYTLQQEDCAVQITGFDPSIIRGNFEASCGTNYGELEGKNVYNLEGSINQIEFRSPSVRLPPGVFEYNPTLNVLTCYQYETHANAEVCVDPSFYQITSEQKACTPRDVSLGGGQAGPIGVSHVGVDMTGRKAVFEITVRNYQSGSRVLSPDVYVRDCGKGIFEFTDFDRIKYNVKLSGGGYLDCKPSDKYVRLHNGQGKIVCTYDIPGTVAFETPLQIDLQYGMMDSFSKQIKIIETPE